MPPLSTTSVAGTAVYQPVAQTERIQTLDILRGVALLGILIMNIWTFGLSSQQFVRGLHGVNYWLFIVIDTLFAGKMRALFSMLFGAGVVLFLMKKQQPGQLNPIELFVRRQLWLMVFGVINAYILIWQWDILFHYGIVGILLFSFRQVSPRTLLVAAIAVGLIYSGKNYWTFAEQKTKYEKYQTAIAIEKKKAKLTATADRDAQKDDKVAWEELRKSYQYDSKAEKAEIAAMRSDYATVWGYRIPKIQKIQANGFYQIWLWDIASMMLLGMALFKWGFFTNQLTTRQYALLAVGCLLIGQAMAWGSLSSYELRYTDFTRYVSTNVLPVYGVLMPFERAFTAVGWASLVVWMYRMGILGWLWQGLRSVGQMAFTNYLMQSVMGTLFFNGYGLGYFGSLQFYQLYFVVAEIWLIQIVFSVVWLKYFRFGPLEWLWRSLTYGKRQPMSLTPAAPSSATSILA
ncbi:DUF418 domain-containing protein [Spirosoma sp. HMF4905]|uniref:DUF418 domain-containing protein n=1 Tax=Spirosoma arboris TaxID=2682092 RepID=A0A7K1S5E4_9BACT|nr:DUF418 domain-containing protein [Spirosoma arboris]MVM29039.1 DUF418 domain-containing protein [Spirosoma arboris]